MTRLAGGLLALALAVADTAADTSITDTAAGASDVLRATSGRVEAALASARASPTDAEIAKLAEAVTAYESALAGLRGAIHGAQDRERGLIHALEKRRLEIARLLAALEALRRTPPPALGAHPDGPLAAARARITLDALAPAMAREAVALGAHLEEIETARTLRLRGVDDLDFGLAELAEAREGLLAALDRREPARSVVASLSAETLREADDLSALAARVADVPGPGVPAGGATRALRWPVAGDVTRAFGEPDAAGVRRPGLTIETPPLALVTSPADAVVRYAGPFLEYGHVVALAPARDTLIVLAGVATLTVRGGDVLRAGDPIGLLGGRTLDAQEYLMLGNPASGETPTETLYIEVRRGQGPVDPAPLFADRNG